MKFEYILLYVSDLNKTASFYEKLGFEIVKKTDNSVVAKLGDFELRCYDQSKVFFKQDVDRFKGAGVFIYISVDDVDKKHSELINKGLQPSGEPKDFEWGNREFAIKNPDGYKIIFYKKLS
ncbi:MAG: VOC family protein [Candidatus Pacebacteria bacterium]|nr:VOC family protein [Candidatus Paceibacterota bacterium]